MGADRQRISGYRILLGCAVLALGAMLLVPVLAYIGVLAHRALQAEPSLELRVSDGFGVAGALYLSPGGDWLAVDNSGTVAFWDLRSGEAVFGVEVPNESWLGVGPHSAAFSPDGQFALVSNPARTGLVSLGDEPAIVWEAGPDQGMAATSRIEFAPDSRSFTVPSLHGGYPRSYRFLEGDDGGVEVRLADMPDPQPAGSPATHEADPAFGRLSLPFFVRHSTLSADLELLGLTTRDSIHIRERRSGESVLEIEGLPVDEFRTLHFIDDDIVLELGTRGEATAYSLGAGEAIHSFPTPTGGHAWQVFTPDRERIAVLRDGRRVEVRSTRTGEVVGLIESPRPLEPVLAFDAAGARLATVTVGGIAEVWDVEAGAVAATVDAYSAPIQSFLVQRHTEWLFARGHRDGGIMLGTSSGRMSERFPARHLHRPDQPERPVLALAASSDGRLLASADGGPAIRIWDTEAMALQVEVRGAEAATSVALHPEGRLLLANSGEAGALQLFDPATGEAVGAGPAAHTGAAAVAMCPAGLRAAAAFADGTVRLYDPGTLELEREILHGGNPLAALAFSPDGELVAASSAARDGATRVYNAATGRLVGEPATKPHDPANCVWLGFGLEGDQLMGITHLGDAFEMRPRAKGFAAGLFRHPMPARPVGGGDLGPDLFCLAGVDGRLYFLQAVDAPRGEAR